jgi:hypothetical protein
VCGYDLALPDPDVLVESCPCCAFHFHRFSEHKLYSYFINEEPNSISVSIGRGMWAQAHLPWYSQTIPRPENWDPTQQVKNIGLDWGNSYDEWMEKHPVIIPENKEKFLKIARERLQELSWQPEFIEAIWDGDTQGWFLCVWVSAKRANDDYNIVRLLRLSGALHNAEVIVGGFVLQELASELGIPSYFPSEDPDESYARFWERDENKRCRTCGKYLYDNQAQCWTCWKRDEKAKKSP